MNYLRKTFLWILLLPYALGFLGAASNQLVFVANHGKFPVAYNETWLSVKDVTTGGMTDDRHCVMTPETHLNFLADIFNFHDSIESVGDVLQEWSESALPYCWGLWLGLILTRKDPDGSEHSLQTMQGAPRRFQSMSLRLLRR